MSEATEILLLTASVDPAASKTPFTNMVDPKQRLEEYLVNIKKIVDEKVFAKIVFCENTNYEFDYQKIIAEARAKNVELEVLRFKGDYDGINKQGKGYGEGEIIKYALKHSKLIGPNSIFYKLTGRIFIKNLASIVKNNTHKDVIFIKAQRTALKVDVRFFKSSVQFFSSHLIDEYTKVNDPGGHFLEMVYYEKLRTVAGISRFTEFPNFTGTSGSTGQAYDQSPYEYFKYSMLLKTGFLNVN